MGFGVVIACAIGATVADAQPSEIAEQESGVLEHAETRTVRVPGTVVEFELVRLPETEPALWVLSTEVTWDLYDVYLYALDEPDEQDGTHDAVTRPSKPYVPPDRGMGRAGYPAIGMTRHAAESFCAWLNAKTELNARLPTPAEFERFASEPTDPVAPEHDAPVPMWTLANSDNRTHPVTSSLPNRLGVYGSLGNVAEWVRTEGKPVAMGGSYRDTPDACTPKSAQQQTSAWNMSDPQIPKSRWWLADCSWVGFRFVIEEE